MAHMALMSKPSTHFQRINSMLFGMQQNATTDGQKTHTRGQTINKRRRSLPLAHVHMLIASAWQEQVDRTLAISINSLFLIKKEARGLQGTVGLHT